MGINVEMNNLENYQSLLYYNNILLEIQGIYQEIAQKIEEQLTTLWIFFRKLRRKIGTVIIIVILRM